MRSILDPSRHHLCLIFKNIAQGSDVFICCVIIYEKAKGKYDLHLGVDNLPTTDLFKPKGLILNLDK